MAPPEPFVAGQGILGWLQSALRDPASWRARAYLVVKLPLAVATVMFVAFWVQGLYWLSYPFWWQAAGASDPLPWLPFAGDTWPHALFVVVAGAVVVLAGPWVIRASGVDRPPAHPGAARATRGRRTRA